MDVKVFSGCTLLKTITIPDDIKLAEIPSETFKGCTSISEIRIPASVKNIEKDSFAGCTAITKVEYLGDEDPTGGENVFKDAIRLDKVITTTNYKGDSFGSKPVEKTIGSDDEEDTGLSTGAIVGIVVACVAVVAIICALVWWLKFYNNAEVTKNNEENTDKNNTEV